MTNEEIKQKFQKHLEELHHRRKHPHWLDRAGYMFENEVPFSMLILGAFFVLAVALQFLYPKALAGATDWGFGEDWPMEKEEEKCSTG